MAIDLNNLFKGYNPADNGYTQNTDGSRPNGWYKNGEENPSNPYGGAFEDYLAKNGVGMWDPGNDNYSRVGMTNQQAFNGLYPSAQQLGQGSSVAGSDPSLSGFNFFTTPNGATPNSDFAQQNVWGRDMGAPASGMLDQIRDHGYMIPLALAAGPAMGAFGASGAGGLEAGQSFMAANDAAMGAGSSIFGGAGAGLSTDLGAASIGAMESGLGSFGLSPMDASGLGDIGTNPFQFDTGGINNFGQNDLFSQDKPWGTNPQDRSWDAFSSNGGLNMGQPQGQSPFDVSSPLNSQQSPFSMSGSSGMAQAGSVPPLEGFVKKYGFDIGKSLYNYLINQKQKKDLEGAGRNATNVMGQPERQAFLNEAQQIAQGNLGAGGDSIRAAIDAQAQARYAKYGYGGTETSRSDVMLAAELAKYGNDRLNSLLGYVGAGQNTSSVAYQAARDSAIFSGMSFQQFSVLAGKIGADNSGPITQAAKDLGNSIMSFFS